MTRNRELYGGEGHSGSDAEKAFNKEASLNKGKKSPRVVSSKFEDGFKKAFPESVSPIELIGRPFQFISKNGVSGFAGTIKSIEVQGKYVVVRTDAEILYHGVLEVCWLVMVEDGTWRVRIKDENLQMRVDDHTYEGGRLSIHA